MDARYDKQYLEGKYGADPYLKKIIDWSDVNNKQLVCNNDKEFSKEFMMVSFNCVVQRFRVK